MCAVGLWSLLCLTDWCLSDAALWLNTKGYSFLHNFPRKRRHNLFTGRSPPAQYHSSLSRAWFRPRKKKRWCLQLLALMWRWWRWWRWHWRRLSHSAPYLVSPEQRRVSDPCHRRRFNEHQITNRNQQPCQWDRTSGLVALIFPQALLPHW